MATTTTATNNTTTIDEVLGTRVATEHSVALSDGCRIVYQAWAPRRDASTKKALVLFHRGHEHSGRWQDLVDRIDLEDYWIFAWDARGHGRSDGERGYAESFARMVRDADEFVRHLAATHDVPVEQMAVLAQSVGAVLAAAWVHDYAPPIRALVLATPAFRVKLYVPFAIPGLRLLRRLRPKSFIKSYVRPQMLTHDAEQARQYASDDLISPQIAVNILLDLHDVSTRLIADAGAIRVPTLMLVSGSDWVVKNKPQLEFFDRLGSSVKSIETYPGFYHSTFWEAEREQPIARSRAFLEAAFAKDSADQDSSHPSSPSPALVDADRQGPTQATFEKLRLPLPRLSPRSMGYAATRISMNTIGRISRGIRTGWRTGFDSGESLDHVYQNRARGFTPLGRVIDRVYLDSPGWEGIRQRKVNLEEMLDRAIDALPRDEVTQILDIAAGPGRYVLDSIVRHQKDGRDLAATLCDRDVGGLEAGRRLARAMGVETATYRENDAFDADAIASLPCRPDVAIVSGLYELFPSNDRVRASLRGLGRAVRPGGYLIYTNQPWHPQQEMIARVLPNRDGEPWVMRCRSQAEMDALVAEAGFRKVDMRIDDAGIFTVSLAIREDVERNGAAQ